MKTTRTMQEIANPRRTTLADLQDADEPAAEVPVDDSGAAQLPPRTANPRRTVLEDSH